MNRLEAIMAILHNSLDTTRKRHMLGGILLSVSVLFGGLALTVVTLKLEENENEYPID